MLRASGRKESDADLAYYTSLGRMIDEFARLETQLQRLLWRETGTAPDVARAIFSGVRADQARSLISRTFEMRGEALPPFLKRAFDHIGVLTQARNDIVHFGARFDKDHGLVVRNTRAAHTPSRLRTMAVSPTILDAMTRDLEVAQYALEARIWEIETPPERRPTSRTLHDLAGSPWRYKLNQQRAPL